MHAACCCCARRASQLRGASQEKGRESGWEGQSLAAGRCRGAVDVGHGGGAIGWNVILDRQTDRQTHTHTQARIRRHRAPPSCVAAARRVSRQQRAAAARVAAARVAAAAACCVLQRTRRRERERIFAWKRRAAHGARAREHIVCSRAARAARAARLHEEKRACVCTVRVFVCVSCACVCACAVSVCVCVSQPALAAANALTARSAAVLA